MKSAKFLIVVMTCAGFLFAQSGGYNAEEKHETKAQEKAENSASKILYGKVVSVNTMMNTIVVKTKHQEETLSVETGAKIMSGKKEIALGDLKSDASVNVTWKMMDGKKTATKIVESSAVTPKK